MPGPGFDSTYEGLKQRSQGLALAEGLGFDSTYEGLKHINWNDPAIRQALVSTVPMRA